MSWRDFISLLSAIRKYHAGRNTGYGILGEKNMKLMMVKDTGDYIDLLAGLATEAYADGVRSLDLSNFSKPGWQKFPGGFMLQWGTLLFNFAGANDLQQLFTFPVAFPNHCLNALPVVHSTVPKHYMVSNYTWQATQAGIACSKVTEGSGNVNVLILAFGF
jgi:hypothetical protein